MHINDLLTKFGGATEDHDGYLVVCPAHADSKPSLKLMVHANRKVGMTCRAGCRNADVVRAAGITWRDLFDVTGEAAVVNADSSTPVTGAPVLQVRRYLERLEYAGTPAVGYAAKRFGISEAVGTEIGLKFDHDGGFEYTTSSFTRFPRLVVPMYDFDGVARGLQGRDLSGECPGRWLSLRNPEGQHWTRYGYFNGPRRPSLAVINEGPGDALAVRSIGLSSVLVRGAALGKSPELAAEIAAGLTGRRAVIAADNDEAGDRFAKSIAVALIAAGHNEVYRMTVRDLGPKSDVADWWERHPAEFEEEFTASLTKARKLRWDGELKHDPRRAAAWKTAVHTTLTEERRIWKAPR